MHEVLVNPLGGLSLPRKSVVRITDRPDMTLDVYCGRKTTMQQQQQCLQIQKSILWFKRYILLSTYNTMTLKIGQVTNNKQVSNHHASRDKDLQFGLWNRWMTCNFMSFLCPASKKIAGFYVIPYKVKYYKGYPANF